jgi:hypothetical protein
MLGQGPTFSLLSNNADIFAGLKKHNYHLRSVFDHSAMTDTISMSVANPVCTPAASGIRIVNEYNGSAKREIEKKKPSPPGNLIKRRIKNMYH